MLWTIWQSLIVCLCSIPLILMTQVHGCLRSHHFSKVLCAYTCMQNRGADCESSLSCCKVCNSGIGRKQVKLVLSFSLEVCFPLVQYRCKDWLQQLIQVSKSFQRLNKNASWQAACKEFLSVSILWEWEIRSSLVLGMFQNQNGWKYSLRQLLFELLEINTYIKCMDLIMKWQYFSCSRKGHRRSRKIETMVF